MPSLPFKVIISPEIHIGVKVINDQEVLLTGYIIWKGINNQAKMQDLESVFAKW